MATSRLNGLRTIATLALISILAYVGYQTVHAGSDVPRQQAGQLTRLTGGSASDKRIDGKSWSLDYDTATMSADGTIAEIDNVRDGVILRDGKPYVHLKAKHVSANMTQGSFWIRGPVRLDEVGGTHRSLATTDAQFIGLTQTLALTNRTTIADGALHVTVEHASINFKTGATDLGRIVGTM